MPNSRLRSTCAPAAHARQEVGRERQRLRLLETTQRQIEANHVHVESKPGSMLAARPRARMKSPPDHEHERNGHLRDDERAPHPETAATPRVVHLQRRDEIRL